MALRRYLTAIEVAQLRRLGFTVDTTITGGTDRLLGKHLVGGMRRVTQLKRLGLR